MFIAAFFAGCGGGGGGGGAANPVASIDPAGETAGLAGQVLIAGQPLAAAQVYLYKSDKAHTAAISGLPSIKASIAPQTVLEDGAYSTVSDQNGNYSFSAIPVGEYTLIAVKDENHQFARTGIVLSTRAQVTTVNAQLTPTGKITGRVVRDSQNIGAAFVYITGTSYVAVTTQTVFSPLIMFRPILRPQQLISCR